MKCADCKHWGEPYGYGWTAISNVKSCDKAKMYWNSTEWAKDADGDDDYINRIEIDPNQLMYVQDGSDYAAHLLTKADFFCAHFEEKVDD